MTVDATSDAGSDKVDGAVGAGVEVGDEVDGADSTLPGADARDYAEHLAALMDVAGFPRMPARLLMALLVSPSGELTADQLSAALNVSSAAVSNAIRYLRSVQLVRVGSLPGTRRRLYSLPDKWFTLTLTRRSMYAELADLARRRPSSIGPETGAGRRIEEAASFYAFLDRRFPELLDEWNAARGEPAGPAD